MKRKYEKPDTKAFPLQSRTPLLDVSYRVNTYSKGGDIYAGDSDEPAASVKENNSIWDN